MVTPPPPQINSGNWIFHRQMGGGLNDFTIYTACLVFYLMFLSLVYQAWISFDVYLFIPIDGYPIVRFLLLFICLFGQRVRPEMIAGVYNTHVSSVPFGILDVKLYKSNSKK